jgi:RNA polymerase sigma factor (sigma-70 family)
VREFEALIAKARSLDADMAERHEAFGELVKRFQDMAYGYAYAILGDFDLAQDAAQETFISAYRNLGRLRDPKAFPSWLRRIVMTQCNRLRRGKHPSAQPIEATMDVPSAYPDPAASAEDRELKDKVLDAIKGLPKHERLATTLFYINGYSQNEIAGFLDVPLTTVKKRLQYSREKLKERMLDMVRDNLQEKRPSKDDRFASMVRLFSALEAAEEDGHLTMLELLLMDGMDVGATDKSGMTLLHRAAQGGHLSSAELLLKNRADVNARDKSGKTPLKWAVEKGHRDVADLLRQHGGIE